MGRRKMKIKFLGTGSPEGMPILSCKCSWCSKAVLKQRLRPCILIQSNTTSILLDIGPDVRAQLLQTKTNIDKIDAAIVTHPHFDHIWGIGDLDQIHWKNKSFIPVYANRETSDYATKYFPWLSLKISILEDYKEKKIGDISIKPIPIVHSNRKDLAMSGFILQSENKKVVYIPDIKGISETALEQSKNADILIIDGQYILGKYIEDEDHAGGTELQELINKFSAKKVFLLAFSEHWYKMSAKDASKKLKNKFIIPDDNDEIII
jgi:phosphoribosyl 1,2-cyclic phosphate phosphodiesterase